MQNSSVITLSNPWTSLPAQAPYILSADAKLVDLFNRQCDQRGRPNYRLDTQLLPDPYIGALNAPLVLLALNPGVGDADRNIHAKTIFREKALANLRQENLRYPFYYLDERLPGDGVRFWKSKLRELIERFGVEHVARNTVCLQFVPYHSKEFSSSMPILPSQEYTFSILRYALARGSTVVVMRSRRLWQEAVPELVGYPKLIELRNPRNPTVSKGNSREEFNRIIEALAS